MTPKQIIIKLKEASGLNPFEKTRRLEVIELRSLLSFLLRDKLHLRWIAIKEVFLEHGRKTSNSSLMNSVNNYKKHKEVNKNLLNFEDLFDFKFEPMDDIPKSQVLESTIRILSKKLKNCEDKNRKDNRNHVFKK